MQLDTTGVWLCRLFLFLLNHCLAKEMRPVQRPLHRARRKGITVRVGTGDNNVYRHGTSCVKWAPIGFPCDAQIATPSVPLSAAVARMRLRASRCDCIATPLPEVPGRFLGAVRATGKPASARGRRSSGFLGIDLLAKRPPLIRGVCCKGAKYSRPQRKWRYLSVFLPSRIRPETETIKDSAPFG